MKTRVQVEVGGGTPCGGESGGRVRCFDGDNYLGAYASVVPGTPNHVGMRRDIVGVLNKWSDEAGGGRDGLVVDVGCGVGALVRDLGEAGWGNVSGVDISPGALSICLRALEGGRGRLAQMDCVRAIRDGSLDAMVATNLLVFDPVPELKIREFRRVLRSGGIMVLSDPVRRYHPVEMLLRSLGSLEGLRFSWLLLRDGNLRAAMSVVREHNRVMEEEGKVYFRSGEELVRMCESVGLQAFLEKTFGGMNYLVKAKRV